MAEKIRVLRLIEYTYDTARAMAADMARWEIQGTRWQGRVRIRSVALPPEIVEELDAPIPAPTDPRILAIQGMLERYATTTIVRPETTLAELLLDLDAILKEQNVDGA